MTKPEPSLTSLETAALMIAMPEVTIDHQGSISKMKQVLQF
jgi:hypothetical protein